MGLQVQSEPTAEEHSKDVLYTIKKDPIVGRYMVASRDIEPGESIFSDDPVAVGESTEIYTNITNQSIRIKIELYYYAFYYYINLFQIRPR